MIDLDVDPRADRADANPVGGFFLIDDERTYEGLHVLTRYLVARATDRRLVARAVIAEEDRAALAAGPGRTMDEGGYDRAAAMLSTPYVWDGNTPDRAMDCSSY